MNISYSQPLSDAWLRTKSFLFQPFNIGTWFVLGFTAFLANISEGFGGGGVSWNNFSSRLDNKLDLESFEGFFENTGDSIGEYLATGLGFGLIMMLILGALILGLVLLWLGSRGNFMFLDNLVHRRTEVTRPWSKFASEANSLFLWQLVYGLVSLMIMGFFALVGFVAFVPLFAGDAGWIVTAPLAILAGTTAFIIMMVMIYVEFFLFAYVVPIMHKERIRTMAAWSRFLVLFREHPGSFVLSGLYYLILSIVGWLTLFFFGLVTCCIGLLLLGLPYVGNVVSLPYSVTLRYFTLDFLGQFGGEFVMLEPVTNLGNNSAQFNNDRTMIGTEDVGEDGSSDEPGPQNGGD